MFACDDFGTVLLAVLGIAVGSPWQDADLLRLLFGERRAPERLFGSRSGRQALASLTSLRLAGHASIAAARRFHAAAQIAHCKRS
jgi:hypothetical protein